MPKRVSQAELDAVLQTVARFPGGASIEDVGKALEIKPSRRTLQRRLALLVRQERLTVDGRGRGSRYKISPTGVQLHVPPIGPSAKVHAPQVEIYVPISSEGGLIKQAVRQPVQHRGPVSYNRAFLDAYRPNDTFYLSPESRERFLELGSTLDGERRVVV